MLYTMAESAQLIVTILGSGTSQGVPMIGCTCPVCRSPDPRDKRSRSSIYVETPSAKILVDTTPDLRMQALREEISRVDAVILTHPHADHIMGFDDLRRFCDMQGVPMPIYGSATTLHQMERIFHYAFDVRKRIPGYLHAVPHVIEGAFTLGGIELTPLPVPHGVISTLGFLFQHEGRKLMAYLSDCAAVPDPIRELITGVDVLIIDGLREAPHPTHLTVDGAIEAIKGIRPKQAYLTHQAHDRTHVARQRRLPPGIDVVYDGMKLKFDL